MDEYEDLVREEVNVETLLVLLELCLDGRKTLITIFRDRGNQLGRRDILRLVRMAPIGCGTGLTMANKLLARK